MVFLYKTMYFLLKSNEVVFSGALMKAVDHSKYLLIFFPHYDQIILKHLMLEIFSWAEPGTGKLHPK